MKKLDKKEHINLFFSAFLVVAFIVCAKFFSDFAANNDVMIAHLIGVSVYAVFGLLLFYATRVGEGKAIFRFSPMTLIFMVLPALYIVISSFSGFMPLHDYFVSDSGKGMAMITVLASMTLGYGIPYTFVSGFELAVEDEASEDSEEKEEVLEGGVEADLLDSEETEEAEEAEEAEEEKEEADESAQAE